MVPDDKTSVSVGLFNVPPESLNPSEPSDAFLEQYKIYLDYLDKLADRRQSANSFFLTLNTGLCAALAFLFTKDAAPEIRQLYIVIPIAGILLALFWHRVVTSYRQLSAGKFAVIHEMESHLPIAPYRTEWDFLGSGKDSTKYLPLTHVEIWVPRLFVIMYIAILSYFVPWRKIGALIASLLS